MPAIKYRAALEAFFLDLGVLILQHKQHACSYQWPVVMPHQLFVQTVHCMHIVVHAVLVTTIQDATSAVQAPGHQGTSQHCCWARGGKGWGFLKVLEASPPQLAGEQGCRWFRYLIGNFWRKGKSVEKESITSGRLMPKMHDWVTGLVSDWWVCYCCYAGGGVVEFLVNTESQVSTPHHA